MAMENNYEGRGLHNKKLLESFTEGKLKGLLDIVKNDDDLVFQIRNNYVNIYYKGGNIAKIESENSIQFDENYLNRTIGTKETREIERKAHCLPKKNAILKKLKDTRNYQDFIDTMKTEMGEYWVWLENERQKELKEKDEQHSLCVNNTEKNDFTVIDLEFQVSTISDYRYKKPYKPNGRYRDEEKNSPRFDIIAVRNSDKQLCVIELKYGTGALVRKSGLGDHADSFEGTIKRNEEAFKKEIRKIIEDKKALGLLSKGFSIKDNSPEFMFAFVANESDENEEKQKDVLKTEMGKQECSDYKVMFLKKEDNYRLCEPVNINDL